MKSLITCHHFFMGQEIFEKTDLYLMVAGDSSGLYAKTYAVGVLYDGPSEWIPTSEDDIADTWSLLLKAGWIYKDTCPLFLIL